MSYIGRYYSGNSLSNEQLYTLNVFNFFFVCQVYINKIVKKGSDLRLNLYIYP